MPENRTFKVQAPHMKGADVAAFQRVLNAQFKQWEWDTRRLKVDGDYGIATRDAAAEVCWGLGFRKGIMDDGISPALRRKIRDRDRTPAESKAWRARADWRRRRRERYSVDVAAPLAKVLADTWGWRPGVHDGIDLICPRDAPIFAICKAKVVRADTGGWWGKAPSGDVSKGDGIIIIRALVNVGPIRKGMNLCYGHAEQPRVKVGDVVTAGQPIGLAGLAVVPHIHFMVNDNSDTRGVGDRDPEPIYRYAVKHN